MGVDVRVFGVRHHGPGCARSLRGALEAFGPECVLVEGPAEVGSEMVGLAGMEGMKPPVALLVYAAEESKRAAFYPFAEFSPEWQAIQYALENKAHFRFMDLPMVHRFGLEKEEEEKFQREMQQKMAAGQGPGAGGGEESGEEEGEEEQAAGTAAGSGPEPHKEPEEDPYLDPLTHLARAAGYADAETWWDHLIESRAGTRAETGAGDAELFAAILEAMTALRESLPRRPEEGRGRFEEKREAWMRQTLRAAMKEGYGKIAVVCGAWHAPVLLPEKLPPAKADEEVLGKLPKVKTAAAWVPWTYGRLSMASGYGAGIASPGWYHHLFERSKPRKGKKKAGVTEPADTDAHGRGSEVAISWMTRIAQLLRKEDMDASSAHIIEAVRLAESLAALRDRPLPSLVELTEATRTVLLFGDAAQLGIIHKKLIVGERLGEVPPEGAVAPLQLDLQKQQKRLRLPPEASEKTLDLDLRKANDLERSELLHRLALLGIPWGKLSDGAGRTKGTFKEIWRVAWEPEFAVRLIEASTLGNSVYDAASAHARRTAAKATDLPPVTELLDRALQASLPEAVAFVLKRVDALAAVTADVMHMMQAVPPLANVVRYGNVRKTDTGLVGHVVRSLLARIMVGLGPACGSLNDEAAAEMEGAISRAHGAVQLLYPPTDRAEGDDESPGKEWLGMLGRLADQGGLHGLVAGRVTRLLLDAGTFSSQDAAQRMSLALSVGNDPANGAAWIEGFLKGSGLILLHDEALWQVLDDWVSAMGEEAFTNVLPLLRRSFAQFPAPERAQMGQRLKRAVAGGGAAAGKRKEQGLDEGRAGKVLGVLRAVLGVK